MAKIDPIIRYFLSNWASMLPTSNATPPMTAMNFDRFMFSLSFFSFTDWVDRCLMISSIVYDNSTTFLVFAIFSLFALFGFVIFVVSNSFPGIIIKLMVETILFDFLFMACMPRQKYDQERNRLVSFSSHFFKVWNKIDIKWVHSSTFSHGIRLTSFIISLSLILISFPYFCLNSFSVRDSNDFFFINCDKSIKDEPFTIKKLRYNDRPGFCFIFIK